jgi:hypothetical protein
MRLLRKGESRHNSHSILAWHVQDLKIRMPAGDDEQCLTSRRPTLACIVRASAMSVHCRIRHKTCTASVLNKHYCSLPDKGGKRGWFGYADIPSPKAEQGVQHRQGTGREMGRMARGAGAGLAFSPCLVVPDGVLPQASGRKAQAVGSGISLVPATLPTL